MNALAQTVLKFPGTIWAVAIAMTVLSLAMATRYDRHILQTDLSKLRNKESLEHGSAYLSRYLDEIFQHYLSPMVILPRKREDARSIALLLKEEKEREGEHSLLASIQTLDDFIPPDQGAKIRILREIESLLPPKIRGRLAESDQKRVAELLTPEAFHPIRQDDLPALVLSKFTEKDGSIGKLVLVEPPLTNDTWEGSKLIHFVHQMREAADKVELGAPVAGTIVITSDMIEAISHDGPRATLFAFLAVVILVVILFRNVKTIGLVLFALALGVIWLGGIILGFGIKINFLNFIALPITFGIGVDYGVNIFQRYRQEGGRDILNILRNTGGAVALSSFTTITGYTSLLIAGNQGFVSFGTLAVAGELTCVVAAIVALPAYLIWRARRAREKP